MKVILLAGGLGTRLSTYTDTIPKPMIDCNGKPFLWYLLQQLYEQGIDEFILLTGYLAEKIEDCVKPGLEHPMIRDKTGFYMSYDNFKILMPMVYSEMISDNMLALNDEGNFKKYKKTCFLFDDSNFKRFLYYVGFRS